MCGNAELARAHCILFRVMLPHGKETAGRMEQTFRSEIQKFYDGCKVFVTGGTGFMGKILIEKLLRSTGVATIYVLARDKRGKDVQSRLDEILEGTVSPDGEFLTLQHARSGRFLTGSGRKRGSSSTGWWQ